jgi:hypothetical protein
MFLIFKNIWLRILLKKTKMSTFSFFLPQKILIFRLDSFSVSGDADPPIVQFNIILPAGRNTPPFSFLEHLLPQSGTSKANHLNLNLYINLSYQFSQSIDPSKLVDNWKLEGLQIHSCQN